ncbi:MAG: ATPase [Pseudomonadota bacterium]|nr:ATPase [Pseudomonadota bacterium]
MKIVVFLAPLFALSAAPAAAEVVKATPEGFEISQTVAVDAPVTRTWEALRAPQKWWDKEHTYSGDSARLYLDAQATGCFCERLDNKGSIEHARIVYIQPPKMMRLVGSLGPLQAEAVIGTLTFTLAADSADKTKLTMTYVVGGYVRGGADSLAPKVDEVLGIQMARLKTLAETPPAPDSAAPADPK